MLRSDREKCRIDQRDIEKLTPQETPLWPWLIAMLLIVLAWWVTGCSPNPWPAEDYTPTSRPECAGLYERHEGFKYHEAGARPTAPYTLLRSCDEAVTDDELFACNKVRR